MKILGIDTSGKVLSIAVVEDEETVIEENILAGRRHSVLLQPVIEKLLEQSGLALDELDGLAVSVGPGSFTGLRIGVTTVKGLAFGSGLPVVGVPTLDVLAANARFFRGIICPVIDARKGKVYARLYRGKGGKLRRESRHLLLTVDELLKKVGRKKILFLGDGIDAYGGVIVRKNKNAVFAPRNLWFPRAGEVALAALSSFKSGRTDNPRTLAPLYVYSHKCSITGK